MKRFKINIQTEVEVDFDESSKEFQELFKAYNEVIANVDYEEFALNIVSHISRYGIKDKIEAVGLINVNDEVQWDFVGNDYKSFPSPINVFIPDRDINGMIEFDLTIVDES